MYKVELLVASLTTFKGITSYLSEFLPYNLLLKGFGETLYMTLISTVISYLIGLPLGILLTITAKDGIRRFPPLNFVLGIVVNFLRSIPFLILLVAVMPITRLVVGTTVGVKATLVPLIIASAPYIARLVESSLKEVDKGVIEAAQSMGASNFTIVFKVLLPEAKPALMVGSAIAVTTILGYSAMAGIVGGGGLGAIALNYGYYRYQADVMYACVILLVIIVQVLQETGMKLARLLDKRI